MNGKLIIVCVFAAAAILPARYAAAEPSAEEKVFQETYGKQIAAVKATTDDADDVALGKQLLLAANDSATSQKLRLVLARAALDLTANSGSADAADAARQAAGMIDSLSPMQPLEKATIERDISARRYARAKTEGKPAADMAPLAHTAAAAYLAVAELLGSDIDNIAKAEAAVAAAKTAVAAYNISDLKDRLDAANKLVQRTKGFSAKLKASLVQVQTAKNSFSKDAIAAANRAVAQVYLEFNGDLASAAKYIAGTGDPDEKAILTAAAFAADQSVPDAKSALSAVEALIRIAQKQTQPAKGNLAQSAMNMCDAVLAANPAEADAAKARLFALQLKTMLEQSPSAGGTSLADLITKTYGTVNGKLEVLDAQRVRISYDFSNVKQLGDWTAHDGQWEVGQGVLGCKPGRWQAATISNQFRFYCDKPFKIFYKGGGADTIGAEMTLLGRGGGTIWDNNHWTIRNDGANAHAFGSDWNDPAVKTSQNTVADFEISGDGKGGYVWSCNGKTIHSFDPKGDVPKFLLNSTFMLRLRAAHAGNSMAAFDNVSVEGAIFVDKPQAPATASQPAPASQPASRPGR